MSCRKKYDIGSQEIRNFKTISTVQGIISTSLTQSQNKNLSSSSTKLKKLDNELFLFCVKSP